MLGVGWKSAFAELFVFARSGPTAPTEVERRSFGVSAPGSRIAVEIRLELVLGLELIRGLVAEFSTAISLLEVVPTEEKSN